MGSQALHYRRLRASREHDRRDAFSRFSHSHPAPARLEHQHATHVHSYRPTTRPNFFLTMPHTKSNSSERSNACTPRYPLMLSPIATASITDLAIHSPCRVHTCAPATQRQATTKGMQATRTRQDERPTDPHSTPPSRRLRTATRIPPFTIPASAVASASPDTPSGAMSSNENAMLAVTATAAEMAGVFVSCSE